MSRNTGVETKLLPVLRVPIDSWRAAPLLGPTFTMPGNLVQAGNAAGHFMAKTVTGREKKENKAFNSLVRDEKDINAMLTKGPVDIGRLKYLIHQAYIDTEIFVSERERRKNPQNAQNAQVITRGQGPHDNASINQPTGYMPQQQQVYASQNQHQQQQWHQPQQQLNYPPQQQWTQQPHTQQQKWQQSRPPQYPPPHNPLPPLQQSRPPPRQLTRNTSMP